MFQKQLKSGQNGFKEVSKQFGKAVKTFNKVRGEVQRRIPQVENVLQKSKQVYEEVVKPNLSQSNRDRVEKVFDVSNQAVNTIKKVDAGIERTKQIFSD